MWGKRRSRTSGRRLVLNESVDLAALLEVLIEHRRDLYEIEDARIRALEVQAAAVSAVAIAALAAIARTFERALDPPRDAAVIVLCLVAAGLATVTVVLSIFARVQYPPRFLWERRRGAARLSELPGILQIKAHPERVRPFTHLADERVDALLEDLRRRYEDQYSGIETGADAVSARLRVMDAWDLRFLSASRRAPRKRLYLTAAFALLFVELLCASVALLLAG
jgi:hypothetical protein